MNTDLELEKNEQEINTENVQEIKIEPETKGHIYLDNLTVCLDSDYENSLLADLALLKTLQERIDAKKEEIKAFIEINGLTSFSTNQLKVKYSSATTTTTLDSAKLKKDLPEIAAKYSKVGVRKSSVSFEVIDTVEEILG